ncbi:hypothetical protein C8R48DRAFT_667298 [Suillus tomentosus]|nr:hypothetical protein C8R48DRAFT_667298 [Suillus tomentosus]
MPIAKIGDERKELRQAQSEIRIRLARHNAIKRLVARRIEEATIRSLYFLEDKGLNGKIERRAQGFDVSDHTVNQRYRPRSWPPMEIRSNLDLAVEKERPHLADMTCGAFRVAPRVKASRASRTRLGLLNADLKRDIVAEAYGGLRGVVDLKLGFFRDVRGDGSDDLKRIAFLI